ncbi:MAG TPA: MaoC family dehydratase [Devosiaceae bacterium]|jgi:acyl dehydratase
MDKFHDLSVGSRLTGKSAPITFTRTRWYEEGIRYAGDANVKQVSTNIHTSHDYARNQGLPAAIADGMLTTQWCSNMLFEYFGMHYLERGELRTKFIKPVYIDRVNSVFGTVLSIDKQADGDTLYTMDIWSEDETGLKLTDGHATVRVTG